MSAVIATDRFTLTTGQALSFSGPSDRYRKNLAAITLLRSLQATARTPESLSDQERLTLAHYTAFGDSELLRRAFGGEAQDLDGLVSEAEAATIRRTALTAFYTSTDVLQAKWAALTPALDQLPGPISILEPAFGIGMYVATMPLELRAQARITAVELDQVSSQIAAYLHPDVQLFGGQGFQETELPKCNYDLVISNVPFGNDKVFDPRMPEAYLTRTIHDYFIARAMMLVRPGGLLAIITSYGTMDKRDARVRSWLAQRAELIRAVRLPQGAFRANAGTECGADLLIFRRFADDVHPSEAPAWVETAMGQVPIVADTGIAFTFNSMISGSDVTELNDTTALLRMGSPFAAHPEQVIGVTRVVNDKGRFFSHVALPTDTSIGAALAERLADLPRDLITPMVETALPPVAHTPRPRIDRDNPRVAGLLAIYHAAKLVIRRDVEQHDATEARAELNARYDQFVTHYGPIHSRTNQQALRGEPELLFLKSLETDVQQGESSISTRKAGIFSQPTVRPMVQLVAGSMTPDEALLRCLDECGAVDLARIGELCGATPGEAASALNGRIYRVPDNERYLTADEYLSGNIRLKLAAAEQAAQRDPSYTANVEALRAVLPTPLTPGQIKVKFGAPWVPQDIVVQFICAIVPGFYGTHHARGTVTYHRPLAKWVVADEAYSRRSHQATVEWGTGRMDAIEIITKGLNNQTPLVYDESQDGCRVINQKESLLAREKLERIKDQWARWVWEDTERTERLCRIYNEQFNSSRRRDFDGSHLTLPGINTTVLRGGDLSRHQKDALWMILQEPSVLLDLAVGAGKTFICLAAAHELKRLGLARKIVITVPNHLVEQWAGEANRLYPDMRVLAMSADDFSKERRGTFLSRIATEDWDAVICAHTSFSLIEVGTLADEYIQREVDSLRSYLKELKGRRQSSRSERRSIKEIERKIQSLETKLKQTEHAVKHDDARIITWEELGVDALLVDEAHEFKNLSIPTAMGNLPGVPKGDSKRAFDMRLKTWELQRRGGRVVFATGTPVLNTLGEVFIMQKYLQEELLIAHGIEHFDAWASTFAEAQTVFEMTPDGGGFRMNTRLCKFVNLPELFQLWFQTTFSRSREQLGLPTPKLIGEKPIAMSVPGSHTLKRLVRSFVGRVEAIKSGRVEPTEDNMLKVTSDGRKAALDVRLVIGGAEEPACKINLLVKTVAELYRRYDAARATQLIYCELSTPKPTRAGKDSPKQEDLIEEAEITGAEEAGKNFVYHEIRAKLAKMGIPAAEVAFIQEHNTKTKRAALFAAMNRGDVRVLICSKQSTGLNIQKRLIALHNLDAPWRPGDLEQRVGRIERQGNAWPEVYVLNYVTERSFDGFIWQTLETKARFIQQMRSGDVTIREIDDISEVVLSAAEIKAIASGNPRIIRKVQLDAELVKLDSLQSSHRDTQVRMRRTLQGMAYDREQIAKRRKLLVAAQEATEAHRGKDFSAAIVTGILTQKAVAYTKREAAGKALRAVVEEAIAAAQTSQDRITRTIGMYQGLLIRVSAWPNHLSPELFLALEHDGTIKPINMAQITCETDLGVFASIDSQVRGIAEGVACLDQTTTTLDQEEEQIHTALAQPWDQAERYTALRAELEALNTELAQSDQPGAAPQASPVVEVQAEAEDVTSGTLEIVAVSDAGADELALEVGSVEQAGWKGLPPIALPEPLNPEAMHAAMATLAETLALTVEEEAEIAAALVVEEAGATIAVETVEAEVAEVLELPVMAHELAGPVLHLVRQDVVTQPRASRSKLAFGNLEQIKQIKRKTSKQTPAAKQQPLDITIDMFAPLEATSTQMSLF